MRDCGFRGRADGAVDRRIGWRRKDGGLVNADALYWLAVAGFVASFLGSIGARALRDFSRHRLQEICEARQTLDRFGEIVRRHDDIGFGVEMFVALTAG